MFSKYKRFSKQVITKAALLGIMLLVFASGCSQNPVSPTVSPGNPTRTLSPLPAQTPTATVTPAPLALRLGSDGVTQAEYEANLQQLQDADQSLGKTADPVDQRKRVLDSLSDELLLAQAAFENGFSLDDGALQAQVDQIAAQMGGETALQDWQTKLGYNDAAFRASLRRASAAAWQRDQITATVPTSAEQVHARQILVFDQDAAEAILAQVQVPGADFTNYAYRYDGLTGGDLGWFPRGYLVQPEVEEAAFALQPGEISPVVHSQVGYHILQVIAREPQRPLSPDALRALQLKALRDWLADRRASHPVEVLVP